MKGEPLKVLPEPRVEVLKDEDGQVETILVRLQDESVKAVRGIQPNRNVMVDIYLDAENRPVFVSFQEPLAGWKGPRRGRKHR